MSLLFNGCPTQQSEDNNEQEDIQRVTIPRNRNLCADSPEDKDTRRHINSRRWCLAIKNATLVGGSDRKEDNVCQPVVGYHSSDTTKYQSQCLR
ncbi:hypothetical protein QLX08_006495 [Tetragonisca angustula]|uniref:Uncharacterized protein n=1 Tax=Tetragonisca angustula TaxID=166442 RepID=A0AAW0ZTV2_9HYME